MYEIHPRFLHQDGSIDQEAASKACRKARAEAAGEVFRAVKRGIVLVVRIVKVAISSGVTGDPTKMPQSLS
jgi:hypothetical protein